ncbi:succinylglutamate desuccinylase/aspartoacylase family protein [Thaumasiovibrio subtropicus]|uniref:succinylglutamate desuccinylase/aspartoacylase family protein n=1 Tax=Thaumasiovibrio subtropicus TaxID=1891207 RepID=UPI000B352ECB|nr:succinylglutamate desuccinylase/aspartoacylase family protein [Thaumasiovibrio subtropicus]
MPDATPPIKDCNNIDLATLPMGHHQCWIPLVQNGIGNWTKVPATIFKSRIPGPTLLITAGIHGDELNSVVTAQRIAREWQGKVTSGCVVILPLLNPNGMLRHSRHFHTADGDLAPYNLNRGFPGNAEGTLPERYCAALWKLIQGIKADYCLDLHTQTKGMAYPLFIYADKSIPECASIATLIQADMLLDDLGQIGVFETEMNRAGIPTLTLEIGAGKRHQPHLVTRAVEGISRVAAHLGLMHQTTSSPLIPAQSGNAVTDVRAVKGGFALGRVEIGDNISAGQILFEQFDSFGNLIETYCAPIAGIVASIAEDPMREPGGLLVRILHSDTN